jgi:hypothetical protein
MIERERSWFALTWHAFTIQHLALGIYLPHDPKGWHENILSSYSVGSNMTAEGII